MDIFEFVAYSFDADKSKASFSYNIKRKNGESYSFIEQLTFSQQPFRVSKDQLTEILFSLHLILGISYWKLYCPQKIVISSGSLTKKQATYWNTVYTKGLGEFFYKNNIDYRDLIHFPSTDIDKKPADIHTQEKALVGIGGGKDSLVSIELLKEHNVPFSGLLIETQKEYSFIQEMKHVLPQDIFHIKRVMDPQVIELSKREDTSDGHIPISAVYAWIAVLAAALYEYKYIIVSNERSANYGNTEYLGTQINHQWSKSEEFETLTQQYIHSYISQDITYFSLLRTYNEMQITKFFSKYTQYHHLFSSCNRNFSISKSNLQKKWCGECPKCAFVFVLLAAYLPKEQVISIFGEDLLNKESLVKTYRELLALEGVKPFECVGTPEETAYAFYLVHQKGEYKGDLIMNIFEKEVLPEVEIEKLEKEVMTSVPSKTTPDTFKTFITQYET